MVASSLLPLLPTPTTAILLGQLALALLALIRTRHDLLLGLKPLYLVLGCLAELPALLQAVACVRCLVAAVVALSVVECARCSDWCSCRWGVDVCGAD